MFGELSNFQAINFFIMAADVTSVKNSNLHVEKKGWLFKNLYSLKGM